MPQFLLVSMIARAGGRPNQAELQHLLAYVWAMSGGGQGWAKLDQSTAHTGMNESQDGVLDGLGCNINQFT